MKQNKKLKQLAIEQLNKTPIIQAVCEKISLPRTTFYRWKEKDKKFAEAVDKAMHEGRYLVNDFAESQLLNAMKNGNLTATFYWLNHNHQNYGNKLEINGKLKTDDGRLTAEQNAGVQQALKLASLLGHNNLITNQDSQEEKSVSSEL